MASTTSATTFLFMVRASAKAMDTAPKVRERAEQSNLLSLVRPPAPSIGETCGGRGPFAQAAAECPAAATLPCSLQPLAKHFDAPALVVADPSEAAPLRPDLQRTIA